MAEENTATEEVGKAAPVEPVDKFPGLTKRVKELQAEKDKILVKSGPLRQQREELLKKIQPLEAKLREVDKERISIEKPRLYEIDMELGALARAMGGRSAATVESK